MIDAAIPYLRCPVCSGTLVRAGETLRCPRGHSFDIARQGYASLTRRGTPHEGDSAAMIEDRAAFLAAGHYDFIAEALTGSLPEAGPPGLVVDAGTGTGFYLAHVLEALPDWSGLGLDVSKPALRRAARAHPRAAAVLADLWQPVPLADASAGLILNVFAPRNGSEFRRILRPGGTLLVVTPAADHLHELIEAFRLIRVDPEKAGRVADALRPHFAPGLTTTHRRTVAVTGAELRTLIGMTPSARHVPLDDLNADRMGVTVAIDLTIYRSDR
jgi:23S rRNA (guanine745-N1)-methyltransferase